MDIFHNIPGMISAVPTAAEATPLSLEIEGWAGESFRAVVDGFQVDTQSGVQFMYTLRDFIYVYVFGERMSKVSISGTAMSYSDLYCFGNVGEPVSGLDYVLAYYNVNRASTRGAPLTIVLGAYTVIEAFLLGASVGLTDADRILYRFSLSFQGIPQSSVLDLG